MSPKPPSPLPAHLTCISKFLNYFADIGHPSLNSTDPTSHNNLQSKLPSTHNLPNSNAFKLNVYNVHAISSLAKSTLYYHSTLNTLRAMRLHDASISLYSASSGSISSSPSRDRSTGLWIM